MRRVLVILILLTAALVSVTFTIANFGDVTVHYLFSEFKAPLSVLIYIALFIGLLTGMLINFFVCFRLRKQLKATQKQLENYTAELKKLRSMPIKDLA